MWWLTLQILHCIQRDVAYRGMLHTEGCCIQRDIFALYCRRNAISLRIEERERYWGLSEEVAMDIGTIVVAGVVGWGWDALHVGMPCSIAVPSS